MLHGRTTRRSEHESMDRQNLRGLSPALVAREAQGPPGQPRDHQDSQDCQNTTRTAKTATKPGNQAKTAGKTRKSGQNSRKSGQNSRKSAKTAGNQPKQQKSGQNSRKSGQNSRKPGIQPKPLPGGCPDPYHGATLGSVPPHTPHTRVPPHHHPVYCQPVHARVRVSVTPMPGQKCQKSGN